MTIKDLGQEVLKTIKEKGVKPKPRWEFLVRDYSLWVVTLLTMVIGGFAFSVVIYMIKNNDWDIYKYMDGDLLGFVFGTLPYFWIVFLILFILVGHYNFKHTKKGYKYRLPLVVLGIIIFNIFLGGFLYNIGIGQAIDGILSERMPWYGRFMNMRQGRWMQIDKGMVAGLIFEVTDDKHFKIKDFRGGEWNVDATEVRIMGELKVEVGSMVRIIGQKISEGMFKAEVIAGGRMPGRHPMMRGGLPFPRQKIKRAISKK